MADEIHEPHKRASSKARIEEVFSAH